MQVRLVTGADGLPEPNEHVNHRHNRAAQVDHPAQIRRHHRHFRGARVFENLPNIEDAHREHLATEHEGEMLLNRRSTRPVSCFQTTRPAPPPVRAPLSCADPGSIELGELTFVRSCTRQREVAADARLAGSRRDERRRLSLSGLLVSRTIGRRRRLTELEERHALLELLGLAAHLLSRGGEFFRRGSVLLSRLARAA